MEAATARKKGATKKAAPAKKNAPGKSTTAKSTKAKPRTKAKKVARKPVVPPPPPRIFEGPATPLQTLARKLRATPSAANRAALAQYAASHKGSTGALAFLALGVADVEQKRFDTAPASLHAAGTRLPELADYASFWSASSYVETGRYDEAAKALEVLWNASPDSPLLPQAAILGARAYQQAGNAAACAALLRRFEDRLPQPKGDAMLGSCLESANDPANAVAPWQRVYYNFPNAPESAASTDALRRLRDRLGPAYPNPTSQMMLSRVDKLVSARQYDAARREAENLIPSLPPADRDVARVRIGAIQYQSGDYRSAVRYLRNLDVSHHEADAERLYYIAAAARRDDNEDEFNRSIDKLSDKYPKSRWRMQALISAGNRYVMQNMPDRYERYFKACYESFPDQPDSAYCQWKVTWSRYLQRNGDADDYLRRHLKLYPFSDKAGAALYFLGRLAEGKNKPQSAVGYYDEIIARFPNSYYALQARDRIAALPAVATRDKDTLRFLQEIQWPARAQDLVFDLTPASKYRLERARLLFAAGLDDWAEGELRHGARKEGPAPLLAMELAVSATRRGSPDQGIRFIKGLVPEYLYVPMPSAPQSFWRLAFPIPFRSTLEANARQYEIDPFRVAALIRQESEFNPRALSYANAYGLAQVMPATGRDLSRRLGIKRYKTSMLFQPEVNLKLGTYYLRSLLNSFSGKWEPTLASYNAGKSRVDAWLTWADYREPAEFVENIPISQTREYVQVVLRNADVYRKLYAAAGSAVTSSNASSAGIPATP